GLRSLSRAPRPTHSLASRHLAAQSPAALRPQWNRHSLLRRSSAVAIRAKLHRLRDPYHSSIESGLVGVWSTTAGTGMLSPMNRVLVADKLAEEGLARIRAESSVAIDVRPGLAPPELAAIVGDYDGMLIRSGVKITAEVLARPGRLRVIARAGVGVDNVDL